jgi:hypothetical protein
MIAKINLKLLRMIPSSNKIYIGLRGFIIRVPTGAYLFTASMTVVK